MTTQITTLVRAAINDAVSESCRWESPYFAHGRLMVVLERDLLDKVDRLLPEPLGELARDLRVAATAAAVKDRIRELATIQVEETLEYRLTARRGWKPFAQ